MDPEEIMAEETLYRQTVYKADASASDPIWIDNVWLDTVVVVGLTCFILCLMGLSKVSRCEGPENDVSMRVKNECKSHASLLLLNRSPLPKWECFTEWPVWRP